MKKALDNRELSWLKFNARVLEEATDPDVPLCERLLFCQIFQSNLDEFFMIRAGSLYDRSLVDNQNVDNKTGMTPAEQLRAIYKRVHEMIPAVETAYADTMRGLDAAGIEDVGWRDILKPISTRRYVRLYPHRWWISVTRSRSSQTRRYMRSPT